jgi:hypothetical protein
MAFSAALSATKILQSFEVAYETIRERKADRGRARVERQPIEVGPWAMTDNWLSGIERRLASNFSPKPQDPTPTP